VHASSCTKRPRLIGNDWERQKSAPQPTGPIPQDTEVPALAHGSHVEEKAPPRTGPRFLPELGFGGRLGSRGKEIRRCRESFPPCDAQKSSAHDERGQGVCPNEEQSHPKWVTECFNEILRKYRALTRGKRTQSRLGSDFPEPAHVLKTGRDSDSHPPPPVGGRARWLARPLSAHWWEIAGGAPGADLTASVDLTAFERCDRRHRSAVSTTLHFLDNALGARPEGR
jgi:hypothetical protein